jgi:hypothetical protein
VKERQLDVRQLPQSAGADKADDGLRNYRKKLKEALDADRTPD